MLSIAILVFSILFVAYNLATNKLEFLQLTLIMLGLIVGLTFY